MKIGKYKIKCVCCVFVCCRKQTDLYKKEPAFKKPNLNHTEYAYREAVNRLKCMLSDSYAPVKLNTFRRHGYESDDADNMSVVERPALSEISKYVPPTTMSRYGSVRRFCSPHSYLNDGPSAACGIVKPADSIASLQAVAASQYGGALASTSTNGQAPPELIQFIEKQEGYIEQLERESQFCRVSNCHTYKCIHALNNSVIFIHIHNYSSTLSQGELNNILEKVKDVISENETLTEQAKHGPNRSDSSESGSNDFEYRSVSKERRDRTTLSGPNIVFESRISELEAQLAQSEMDVKKLTHENSAQKMKMTGSFSEPGCVDVYKRQVDNLQRYVLLTLTCFFFNRKSLRLN